MWNLARSPEQTNIITSSEVAGKGQRYRAGNRRALFFMLLTGHSTVRRHHCEITFRLAETPVPFRIHSCLHSQSTIEV
jgi:hypothetical protein